MKCDWILVNDNGKVEGYGSTMIKKYGKEHYRLKRNSIIEFKTGYIKTITFNCSCGKKHRPRFWE